MNVVTACLLLILRQLGNCLIRMGCFELVENVALLLKAQIVEARPRDLLPRSAVDPGGPCLRCKRSSTVLYSMRKKTIVIGLRLRRTKPTLL